MKLGQDNADATDVFGREKRVYYLTFTKDHDRDQAIKAFAKKFGRQPAEIFVENRVLWLGPALEK